MKAYALDLRERVVNFVREGGGKTEAAVRFGVCRRSVYRYLASAQAGVLAPKKSWGSWRKLDPEKLRAHVGKHPDATLKELQAVFGVSHHALWVRLRTMGFTLKKSHALPRTRRGAALAVPARTRGSGRRARVLARRVRRGSSPVP